MTYPDKSQTIFSFVLEEPNLTLTLDYKDNNDKETDMVNILQTQISDNGYRIQFDIDFKEDLDIQMIYDFVNHLVVNSLSYALTYAKSLMISRLHKLIEEVRSDSP